MTGKSSSGAMISKCGRYRYHLWRRWDLGIDPGAVAWVMLNPSTATAEIDDPTIRRCIGFARAWGYAGIDVYNLFALRSSDPDELKRWSNPVGPENGKWLLNLTIGYPLVIAAWGASPIARERGAKLTAAMAARRPLSCLGLTAAGAPRHPLYVRADARPVPYTGRVPG